MKRAVNALMHIILLITCFDIMTWIGICYCREKIIPRMIEMHEAARGIKRMAIYVFNYYQDCKRVPKSVRDVCKKYEHTALTLFDIDYNAVDSGRENWELVIRDRWNTLFQIDSDNKEIALVSAGPDQEFGTDDDMRYQIRTENLHESPVSKEFREIMRERTRRAVDYRRNSK